MTVRPILFSAPMIRALLDGSKTQTRRLVKWTAEPGLNLSFSGLALENTAPGHFALVSRGAGGCWNERARTRTFAPGDVLWVRETLRYDWGHGAWFRDADATRLLPGDTLDTPRPGRWPLGVCASIYLPRTLSRLTLDVTSVKVERLQSISWSDAIAEGCPGRLGPNPDFPDEWDPSPVEQYRDLWNTINDKPGVRWADNPWVVAVSFDVHRANVDAHLASLSAAAVIPAQAGTDTAPKEPAA